jgi:hypothetical protein
MGFIAHRHETFYDALFEGLRQLGYAEGRNLIIERRYAEGRVERFQEFAAEMVRLKVDIIVVVTTPAALPPKKAVPTFSAGAATRSSRDRPRHEAGAVAQQQKYQQASTRYPGPLSDADRQRLHRQQDEGQKEHAASGGPDTGFHGRVHAVGATAQLRRCELVPARCEERRVGTLKTMRLSARSVN